MVLWTHTHGFANEAFHDRQDAMLDGLRDIGIPSVAYHLDRWWGLEREHQVSEPYFQCDLVCTADGGHDAEWASIGVNHVWMPPAMVHTEVGRGSYNSRYAKDVGFVGHWMTYGHRDIWPWRFEMVAHLHKRYRSKFRAWPRGNRPVRGTDLNDLYATVKVIVGDSCLVGSASRYSSDRIPETLGRGGFLIHPRVEGVTDGSLYTEGEHLACFDVGNLAELDETIDRYLADAPARARITEAAMAHVEAHHTYLRRMESLMKLVDGL
jgi:hypothetical protein